MNYLLGIDFGGGASKATLLSETGEIIAESTVEYPTLHPTPDACEQRPEDWLRALCQNCHAILSLSGVSPSSILAVALDSATHTFVPCDENFLPLRPAIHWTDSRSRGEAALLNDQWGDLIYQQTYHRPGVIWTLPQLLWLKSNEPDIFSKTKRLFFEKDYIRYFLTGIYCTDRIEAQGSMFFDCTRNIWSPELCAVAGIDPAALPPILEPTDNAGTVTPEAAAATGLSVGTPVIVGTTDTALEVFAAGAVSKGDMTVKLATAGRICVMTDRPYPDLHLVNYSHIVKGLWYPGSATKAAASSFRWYRDAFGGDYKELDAAAESIPAGSEGLLFHPYINGELTPLASPLACGSFCGIRSTHTKAHFSRAVLEGVAFSLLDSLQYLDSKEMPYDTSHPATLIGGGAKSPLWRQITADVLGIALRTTVSSDSSLGSAMLAGISAGVFADAVKASAMCVKTRDLVLPDPSRTAIYAACFQNYKAIQKALVPLYEKQSGDCQ